MAISEFDIIATYFNKTGLIPNAEQKQNLPLGIGDDCAVLSVPEGKQLALSMDILVADIHFPLAADPALIAQRALAVNLSDLAAMGTEPLAFTLGLCIPEADEKWLSAFSRGLAKSAQKYQCPLVGGDMSRGALSISIQVHGIIDSGKAIKRSGARPGDKVYVTGRLGEAGLALELFNNTLENVTAAEEAVLMQAFYQPEPRLESGEAMVGLASAAIDVSDGLLADLAHIAHQSNVGIRVELEEVPLSPTVQSIIGHDKAMQYALTAGDDYELVMTVAPELSEMLEKAVANTNVALTCIGSVVAGANVSCINDKGNQVDLASEDFSFVKGYQHF